MAKHRRPSKIRVTGPKVRPVITAAGWTLRLAWVAYVVSQHLP